MATDWLDLDDAPTGLAAVADISIKIAGDAEAQIAFAKSNPRRSLEACDAELDRLLDDVALLAKGIAIIARHLSKAEPQQ